MIHRMARGMARRMIRMTGLGGHGLASRLAQQEAVNAQLLAGQIALSAAIDNVRRHVEQGNREARTVLSQLALPPAALWRGKPDVAAANPPLGVFHCSTVCRQEMFDQPYFAYWVGRLGLTSRYHRKLWEFVFVCQVLFERQLLGPGLRGLGFGVGEEPLSALFASFGCEVVGTDMAPEEAKAAGWTDTQQYAAGKAALRNPGLCPDDLFDAKVQFRVCDMNAVSDDLTGFDFCWSACALEHLGSIEHGLAFIERSIDCLRPGGFAVHTTEFNLNPGDETLETGGTVLFRRRDLEDLAARLAKKGHTVAPFDFRAGHTEVDRYVDLPPYRDDPHLRLALEGFPATSVGLIVQKGWN